MRNVRMEILEAAAQCVNGVREDEYGIPEDNFALIADFWSRYLGFSVGQIKPRDVAAMMALLKIARAAHSKKRDNWIDVAGYAACGGEIDDPEQGTAG